MQHAVFTAVLVFLFVLVLTPRRGELVIIVISSFAALAAQSIGLLSGRAVPIAFGAACLIAILPRTTDRAAYERTRLHFVICGSAVLPLASTLALVGQQLTVFHLSTYGLSAYLVDSAYGFSPSAMLGRLLWASAGGHRLLQFVYGWLPAALSICYVLNVRAGNRNADTLLRAALTSGLVAFVLYHFYPAAGPIYAFGSDFPAGLPDPAALAPSPMVLAVPGAPRNCMPSVHLAWALLAVLESRFLGWPSRVMFAIFAVLTAFATIALGEHYIIDLVVALPFTLGIYASCGHNGSPLANRWRTAAFGAFVTLGWFLFLRVWEPPPHFSPLLWMMSVSTIAATTLVCRGYLRAPRSVVLSANGGPVRSLTVEEIRLEA